MHLSSSCLIKYCRKNILSLLLKPDDTGLYHQTTCFGQGMDISKHLNVGCAGSHFENRLLLVPLTGLVNSPFSFIKIGLDFGGLRLVRGQ